VEIPALKHIETQTALKNMLLGANLLKHKKKSFPHLRLFQISTDLKRLFWYTKSKKIQEAQVSIDQIAEITFGQSTGNFRSFPLKVLEDFSFTLYYYKNKNFEKQEILELTCKDEREFDLWVIGIKALCAHNCGKLICKDALLLHSKSYLDQVRKGNLAKCSSYLFYPPAAVSEEKSYVISNNVDFNDKKNKDYNTNNNAYSNNNDIKNVKSSITNENFERKNYAVHNPNLIDFNDNVNHNNNNNSNLINFENNKDEEVLDSERNWLPLNNQKYLLSNRENKALNDFPNKNNNLNNNNNFHDDQEYQTTRKSTAENKQKSLDQFIVARNLNKYQLAKLIFELAMKFKHIRGEVEFYSSHDEYKTGKAEENYDMIFSEEAIADDLDSQKGQMINLYRESQVNLSKIISEFLNFEFKHLNNNYTKKSIDNNCNNTNNYNNKNENYEEEYEEGKDKFEKISLSVENDFEQNDLDIEGEIDGYKKLLGKLRVCLETFLDKYNSSKDTKMLFLHNITDEKQFMKAIDLNIWKIEIDLENICDILNRFNSNKDVGFVDKIKNVFKNFFK